MTEETKRLLLGSFLAIFVGIIFRTASDIQDGLSLRNVGVGWCSWHLFGWIARDVPQAILIIYMTMRTLKNVSIEEKINLVLYFLFNLLVSAVLSFFWHDFVYNWTLNHLYLFNW